MFVTEWFNGTQEKSAFFLRNTLCEPGKLRHTLLTSLCAKAPLPLSSHMHKQIQAHMLALKTAVF